MRPLLAVVLLFLPLAAFADEAGIHVDHVWSRAAMAGHEGMVYLTITDTGPPDTLTGISTPVAAMVAALLFVSPAHFYAIDFAGYVGNFGVWLTGSYRRGKLNADHAVASGVTLERFDNDPSVHPICQRGHDPYICRQVFEIHALIVLVGMMMLVRYVRAVGVPRSRR
jgi:hypothetical protein